MGRKQEIYQAAKDGNLTRLQMWIGHYPRTIRRKLVKERSEGMTPLTIACRNGHVDVVEYLLDECGAHLEQRVRRHESRLAEDGPQPLCWATHEGHLSVVRSLVTRGANVNCNSRIWSSPLIQACMRGDLQMAKYLVANGAVVKVSRMNGRTALCCACQRGHYQIACYLIRNGADLFLEGTTALQSCIRSLKLKCMKLLLRYGAEVDGVLHEMTPLLLTRCSEYPQTVEYSLCLPFIQRYPLVDIELLGVSSWNINRRKPFTLPNERRRVEMEQVNGFRVRIVKLNRRDDQEWINVLHFSKPGIGPVAGRTVTVGCFFCQGRRHKAIPSNEQSDISTWEMLAAIQRLSSTPVSLLTHRSICSVTNLFVNMMLHNRKLAYELVVVVFVLTVKEVEIITEAERDWVQFRKVLNAAINLALCLLRFQTDMSVEHRRLFDGAVGELIRLDPRDYRSRTPLHLICSRNPHEFAPLASESILEAFNLLLDAGAVQEAVDDRKNSPLHRVAMSRPVKYEVIDLLLSRGAHFDARNVHRQCFTQLLPEAERHRYRWCDRLSLQCLAATAIVNRDIPYDVLPEALIHFVNLH